MCTGLMIPYKLLLLSFKIAPVHPYTLREQNTATKCILVFSVSSYRTLFLFLHPPSQFSSCISTPSGSVFILPCAFFSFSQPFPDPAKRAILRAHVWIGMDCGVTQVPSLLMLVSCQVTSESCSILCDVRFLPFSTPWYIYGTVAVFYT